MRAFVGALTVLSLTALTHLVGNRSALAGPPRSRPGPAPVRPAGDLPGVDEEPNAAADIALEWLSRNATYTASSILTDGEFVWSALPSLLTGEGPLHSYPPGEKDTFAFHTNLEDQPCVVIKLQAAAPIERIFIEDRRVNTSGMRFRGSGMGVWVSMDGNSWEPVWRARSGQPSWTIRFPAPVTAQYVRVGTVGREYLNLAAVRIYGPPVGLPYLTRLPDADRLLTRDNRTVTGTIENTSFTISAAFGKANVPASGVVGILGEANEPSRVRLVLADGQVLVGTLADANLRIRPAIGPPVSFRLQDVSQAAWRISKDKPGEFSSRDAMVLLAGGERLAYAGWEPNLSVATGYGPLDVPFACLRRIEAAASPQKDARILLAGGSEISGKLRPGKLLLRLRSFGELRTDVASLRLVSGPEAGPAADGAVSVQMRCGDRLVGRLVEKELAFQTSEGNVVLDPQSLRSAIFGVKESGTPTIRLWNDSVLKGSLTESTVGVLLGRDGPAVRVKKSDIASIVNPSPLPPREIQAKVQALVKQLGADSYQDRQAAQEALVAMGQGILPLIEPHLKHEDAEVRVRIAAIIEKWKPNG